MILTWQGTAKAALEASFIGQQGRRKPRNKAQSRDKLQCGFTQDQSAQSTLRALSWPVQVCAVLWAGPWFHSCSGVVKLGLHVALVLGPLSHMGPEPAEWTFSSLSSGLDLCLWKTCLLFSSVVIPAKAF